MTSLLSLFLCYCYGPHEVKPNQLQSNGLLTIIVVFITIIVIIIVNIIIIIIVIIIIIINF